MVSLVIILVSSVEMNAVIYVHILVWIDGPLIFHIPDESIFQYTVSLQACGDFILILYR